MLQYIVELSVFLLSTMVLEYFKSEFCGQTRFSFLIQGTMFWKNSNVDFYCQF